MFHLMVDLMLHWKLHLMVDLNTGFGWPPLHSLKAIEDA